KYNRPFPYAKNAQKALARLLPKLPLMPNEEIQSLLNDENPKSRALGLLALYQSDNQNSLLQLKVYFSDSAECYKQTPYNRFSSDGFLSDKRPTLESLLVKVKTLTVGEIAKTLFNHYFLQLGYSSIDSALIEPNKESKDLNYSSGFLKWLTLKAT